ncbi:MAG: hypothetical protein BroJett029_42320 [Alphaproteobacteria bacterium]|nr:MAG: hypothetical protein BroJett029_42320 [Alphaproteobacteria bacterium]
MRQLWMILAIGSLAALPACADREARMDTSAPTVTFEYDDDDDYDEIVQKAELYCEEQYDRDAVLVDRDADADDLDDDLDDDADIDYQATFACE